MSLAETSATPDAAWQIKTLVQSAAALLKSGDTAGAEDIYRRVLEVAPFNGPALSFFARSAYTAGNLQEALALIDKAQQGAPRNPRHYHNRAQILKALGRLEDAIRDLDTARELLPNFSLPLFQKALLLRDLGQRETAVRTAIEAWQHYPEAILVDVASEAANLPQSTRDIIRETANLIRATQLVMVDSELEPVIDRHGKDALQRLFAALSAFTGLTQAEPAGAQLRPGLSLAGLAAPETPAWADALRGRNGEIAALARRITGANSAELIRIAVDADGIDDHRKLLTLLEGVPLVPAPDGGVSVILAPAGIHRLSLANGHNWRQEAYLALELPEKVALSFGTDNLVPETGEVYLGRSEQPHHLQIGSGGSALLLSLSTWHPGLSAAEREGLPAALRGMRRFNAKYNTAVAAA